MTCLFVDVFFLFFFSSSLTFFPALDFFSLLITPASTLHTKYIHIHRLGAGAGAVDGHQVWLVLSSFAIYTWGGR